MAKRGSRSLFSRFLLSYIAVMLIPAAVLYLLYTKQTADTVIEEVYASVQLDQQYAISLIDLQIDALSKTANQFRLTRGFRSYEENHSFFSEQGNETYGEIIEDLFVLGQRSPFTENLFVYFHDPRCAFSARGLHQIDRFISEEYRYDNYTPQAFIRLLGSLEEPTVLSMQEASIHKNNSNYMTFIFPLREGFHRHVATAVFGVEEQFITAMLSARMKQYNTSTYIYQKDGSLLYTNNPLAGFNPDNQASYAGEYRFVMQVSPQTGWQFLTLIPNSQPILTQVFSLGRTFITYSALTLILSSFVIWYMMRVNYKPIRTLKDKAAGFSAPTAPKGDLEAISSALDYLQGQNEQLNTTVIEQSTLVANNELRKLLSGNFKTVEDFNRDSPQHMHYHGSYFFAAVILFHHPDDCTETLAKEISRMVESRFESNYIYHLEPDKLVTINCLADAVNHVITDTYCAVLRTLSETFGISATIGVGSITQSTMQISKSYLEAQSAIDYRFVRGKDTVILYSDIAQGNDSFPAYPHQHFERLRNAVSAMDSSMADESIQALLQYLTENLVPLFLARGICFDILRIISENESRQDPGKNLLEGDSLQEIASAETAQDLIAMIQDLQKSISCGKNDPGNARQRTQAKLMGYLAEHCYSCDFSIQTLAKNLDILPSNLSALFKANTGGNLLDYVTGMRMEKAKKLLIETNDSITQIAQQVGYYNVSSFVRRFREHQGITPGVYRSSLKNKTQN